jgi:hypothetical protein
VNAEEDEGFSGTGLGMHRILILLDIRPAEYQKPDTGYPAGILNQPLNV